MQQKVEQENLKMGKYLKRNFTKEDRDDKLAYELKFNISLKMQIKTVMRCHYTSSGMVKVLI